MVYTVVFYPQTASHAYSITRWLYGNVTLGVRAQPIITM